MSVVISVVIDEAVLRQCLKYQVNAPVFMIQALLEELHSKAVEEELHLRKKCPHCGRFHE